MQKEMVSLAWSAMSKTGQEKRLLVLTKSFGSLHDAFGEIKGLLQARPVFHWSEERIIGYLIACFLAYFCEAQMTKMLRQ